MRRLDLEKLHNRIFLGHVEQSHNWSTNWESSTQRLTLMECMLLEMLEAPSHVCERNIAGRQGGINRLQSRALHDRGASAKRRQIKRLEYRVACILF